jgi:hypothetical protein
VGPSSARRNSNTNPRRLFIDNVPFLWIPAPNYGPGQVLLFLKLVLRVTVSR